MTTTALWCPSDCPLLEVAPDSFWEGDYDYDEYLDDYDLDEFDDYGDESDEEHEAFSDKYDLSEFQLVDTPWKPLLPAYVRLLEESSMYDERDRKARDIWKGEVTDYRAWADVKEGYSPRITWRGTPTIWDRIFAVFPMEECEYKTPSKKRHEADRSPRNVRRDWSRRGHGEDRGKSRYETEFVGRKRNSRKRRGMPYVGHFEAELRVRADRVQTKRALRAVQAGMIDPWEINLPGKIPALTAESLSA